MKEEEEIRWVGRCVAIEMIGTTIHEELKYIVERRLYTKVWLIY